MPETDEDPRDSRFMDLFEAALELPSASRRDWVTQQCAEDPQLASEILASLAREEKMAGFLTRPLVPRADPEPDLTPEQNLGDRIRIVRRIAEGGMATVYEAIDAKIGPVAVKVPKPPFRHRLIAEAKHSLLVTHPNICRVYHVDGAQVGDRIVEYLTMELLHGEPLQARISRGPLPLAALRSLTEQLARGLDEAHQCGVVHADLKGNNVILTESSSGQFRAVITDFGISRQHEPGSAPLVASLRGDPEFIAPELWEGAPATPASDLYAFGVLLYEAGTGVRVPVTEDARIVAPRKLRPELDEHWSDFVRRCLERDPDRRPVSALAALTGAATRSYSLWSVLAIGVLLAGSVIGSFRIFSGERHAQRVRLAIIPPDTDSASASWGTGMLRQVSDEAARFRSDAGPVIVVPWAGGEDVENDVRTAGATHLVKVRFRADSGRISALGTLRHVPTNRDMRTFGGNYDKSSMASIPHAILGAISAALALTGPGNTVRISSAAWPDYARGLGYLQAVPPSLEDALLAFMSAAAADAASALPWARIAETHLIKYSSLRKAEYLRSAESALLEAEKRNPDELEVHLAAGLYYTQASLPERAVVEFSRVLQREPGNVDAVCRLARAYADMNLPGEALKTWDTALEMLPTDYRTHLDVGQFHYRQSRYSEAVKHWTEVTRLAPRLGRGFHNLGAALNDLARYAEAEQAFKRASELDENANTLIGLGSILTYQGRIPESVPYFEKAVKVGPPNHIMLSNLGDVYRLTGRASEARSAYRQALLLADDVLIQQPRDAYVRAYVAYISARLGDRARAEREAEQAIRFGPDAAKAVRVTVLTFAALGNADRAMQLVERLPSLKTELSRHPDAGMFAGKLRN